MDSQGGDKQKQGGVAKDKDSIRAAILDEAVIVGHFLFLCSKMWC